MAGFLGFASVGLRSQACPLPAHPLCPLQKSSNVADCLKSKNWTRVNFGLCPVNIEIVLITFTKVSMVLSNVCPTSI